MHARGIGSGSSSQHTPWQRGGPWRRRRLAALAMALAASLVVPALAGPAWQPPPEPAARQWSLFPVQPPAGGLHLGLAAVAPEDGELARDVELLSPQPRDASTVDGPLAFGHRVAADLRDLLRAPRHLDARRWKLLSTGALAIGIAHLVDDEARTAVLRHGGGDGGRQLAESIRPLGQEGGLILAALAWASGEATGRENLSAVAQDSLEATVVAAGFITPVLKTVVGRSRPRSGSDSDSFPGGAESFPSGEVTQAFAMASVISAHSRRRWVDALAWAGAATIAWQRMRLDAHWFSDVTTGALIGAATGRWIVRRNHPEVLAERDGWRRFASSWQAQPILGEHRMGLVFRVTF